VRFPRAFVDASYIFLTKEGEEGEEIPLGLNQDWFNAEQNSEMPAWFLVRAIRDEKTATNSVIADLVWRKYISTTRGVNGCRIISRHSGFSDQPGATRKAAGRESRDDDRARADYDTRVENLKQKRPLLPAKYKMIPRDWWAELRRREKRNHVHVTDDFEMNACEMTPRLRGVADAARCCSLLRRPNS